MNKKIGIITGVIIVIIILVVAVCIFTKSDSNKENSENETGSFSNTSFSINGYTIDIKSKEVGHPSEGTYFETSFELSSNNKSTYFVDFVDLKDIENSDKTYNSAKEEVTINDKTYNYFIEEDTWNATLYYQIPKENKYLIIEVRGGDVFDSEGNQVKTLANIDKKVLNSKELAEILNYTITKK